MPRHRHPGSPAFYGFRHGRSTRSGARTAFTLVELLSVIAITAVLAGLAIISFKGVFLKTHTAACSSNLRQIGVAFQLYLVDHDNVLPQRFYESAKLEGIAVNLGYDELLLPYIGNDARIFRCPELKTPSANQPSYGMNWYYDNVNVMIVEKPGATILATDTKGTRGGGSHRADRDSGDPGQLDTERHSGQANYLFFDGHVKSMRWLDTVGQLDMWGSDYGRHSEDPPLPYSK